MNSKTLPTCDYSALMRDLLPKDYSKMTEEELLEELKKSPDFEKFVYPSSWYEKYKLPLKECMNMKEYLRESPWKKSSGNFYVGKIQDISAKPGGNRPVLEVEQPPALTVIENHFSDGPHADEDIVITNQTSSSHPQDSVQTSASSTEPNETKILQF